MDIFARTVRIAASAVFIGFFAVFAATALYGGIVNIGNIFGAAVSALLAAAFIFSEKSAKILSSLWKSTGGRIFLSVSGIIIIFFAVAAIFMSVLMIKAMNDYPQNENTTLVVLGCKVKNGAPSFMLKRRLIAARDYLSAHESVKVVVSGGQGQDEIISEAQCMRDYLVSEGISPDRIFMEDKSVNTEQNLSFSREIIKNNNLSEDITIVTDGFHQYRAEMFAKRQGTNPHNISAHTPAWLVPTYWIREWFGIAYYAVFG